MATIEGLGTTISVLVSGSFVSIAEVTHITPCPIAIASRDTTYLGSSWGQMQPTGLPKLGEASFEVLYTYANHGYVISLVTATVNGTWMLTYANGDSETFSAHLTGFDFGDVTPEGNVTATIKLQGSDAPIIN